MTSAELEAELGLPSGHYERAVGVARRHRVTTETASQLGARALARALADVNLDLDDVDVLVAASATMDFVVPNRASSILAELAPGYPCDIACVDVDATCISFLAALHHAALLLATGGARRVAIVSAEISRYGLDPGDPEPYGLFGDGAAAAVVSRCPDRSAGLLRYRTRTYPAGHDLCVVRGGGNAFPPRHFAYSPELYGFHMAGRRLLRLVADRLPGFLRDYGLAAPRYGAQPRRPARRVLAEAESVGARGFAAVRDDRRAPRRGRPTTTCPRSAMPGADDTPRALTDLLVPHQTSALGLRLLARALGPEAPPMVDTLARTGNCVAASVPLALDHAIRSGRLQRGEVCTLLGSAAGLSFGALTFRY